MKIVQICPDSFAANTYLLISGDAALVVDPAVSVYAIERRLKDYGAYLHGIVLTHGHFDHTISVDTLRGKYDIPLLIHSGDAPMLTDGLINGFYDFYGRSCTHRPADALLNDGQEISIGNEVIKVISTPGHSPGSICMLCTDESGDNFLITGDTLFSNSIGRCDLWNGSDTLIKASLQVLSALPSNMSIYPGHGPSSTLADALKMARYYIDF